MRAIEALGEAWNHGCEIFMRNLDNGLEGLNHKSRCAYRKYLDLETLLCTPEAPIFHCWDRGTFAMPKVRLS